MFERELKKFRSLFRKRKYILTIHALEEMGEDDILDEDIEISSSEAESSNGKWTVGPKNENTFSPEQTMLVNR